MKKFIYDSSYIRRIFFTSDTHFHHENIIKYCNRPFSSIQEHDEELIKRWNSVVTRDDDIVFHLGDVGFGHPKEINDILDRLNGKIYLVIGNHDWRRVISQHAHRFEEMTQQINMKIDGQHIILNHFPLLCFSGSYRGSWQLFGHVHTSPYNNDGLDFPRLNMLFPTQYDVGVDNNDFKPVPFLKVKEIIDEKLRSNLELEMK